MNMQVINNKAPSGFRPLTAEEIMAVSGGGDVMIDDEGEVIVVTGPKRQEPAILSVNTIIPLSWFGGGGGGLDYGSLYFGGGGGGSQEETTERVFDPNEDHCTGVPDSIAGISVARACFTHDNNYSQDSTIDRAAADWQFVLDITEILVRDGGYTERQASELALPYYTGVRAFGWLFYDGQGDSR